MSDRNRNTAILLIGAGVFILLGSQVGFWSIIALVMLVYGWFRLQAGDRNTGLLLIILGGILLLRELWWLVAILLISLGYFYLKSNTLHEKFPELQKSQLFGTLRWDRDPWELKNISLWHAVGDVKMDFSLAMNDQEVTTIVLQGVVGDIDIWIPEDLAIEVEASILVGEIKVGSEQASGIMNKIKLQSVGYEESDAKIKLLITYAIGDVKIKTLT